MNRYIDIHTHKRFATENLVLYNLGINEDADKEHNTFGIHPWELGKIETAYYFDKLKKYCNEGLLIAVGEIGMDRSLDYPIFLQSTVFEQQQAIANKYNLPVIIHCVRAWSDFLSIRKRIKKNSPWIFHGYNGSLNTAEQLINKGCYISFGQLLLINSKNQEVFKNLPLESIFLETDNSDQKIETIYQKAADLRHICIEDLKTQIEQNFNTAFNKK